MGTTLASTAPPSPFNGASDEASSEVLITSHNKSSGKLLVNTNEGSSPTFTAVQTGNSDGSCRSFATSFATAKTNAPSGTRHGHSPSSSVENYSPSSSNGTATIKKTPQQRSNKPRNVQLTTQKRRQQSAKIVSSKESATRHAEEQQRIRIEREALERFQKAQEEQKKKKDATSHLELEERKLREKQETERRNDQSELLPHQREGADKYTPSDTAITEYDAEHPKKAIDVPKNPSNAFHFFSKDHREAIKGASPSATFGEVVSLSFNAL